MALAELLNPPSDQQTSLPRPRRLHARPTLLPDTAGRWSLRVDLKDDEIARLYAQGLTRGALVWRTGMPEWRPLLITPELSRLLRSTPIKRRDASAPALADAVTLPRTARLPSLPLDEADAERSTKDVPTVAPTALDVAPAPAKPVRRGFELLAVAAVGFGLAWIVRGEAEPPSAPAPLAAALPPAPVSSAEPARSGGNAATVLASSGGIPTVSLTDLPVLASGTAFVGRARSHVATRRSPTSSARSSSQGPTRAELVAALNQVASVASGCGERSGPVRVVIAFAPSGVARSIQVSGKELPSPVRSCIIGAASRVRVASFSGEPVTVSKTL